MAKTKQINPLLIKELSVRTQIKHSTAKSPAKRSKVIEAITYDIQHYTKLYHDENITNIICANLPLYALRIYNYMAQKLGKDSDVIRMTYDQLMSVTGTSSKATITESLKTLKYFNIIRDKSRSVYWVNPRYMFNGNRLDYYTKNAPHLIKETNPNFNPKDFEPK